MPFAVTTRDRVMGALALPVTVYYVQHVDDALTHAKTYGGETTVTRIEGYLTQYEAQETALNGAAEGAGLIKADVLEWAIGAKTGGFKTEMMRLRGNIADALNLRCIMRGNGVRLVR